MPIIIAKGGAIAVSICSAGVVSLYCAAAGAPIRIGCIMVITLLGLSINDTVPTNYHIGTLGCIGLTDPIYALARIL